jgi:merlin protein
MSFLFSGRSKRLIYVKVTTMDADLDAIPIEANCYGRDLFDMVCRIIGMREVWYFGLQHTNKKGFPCWLQLDKKILSQGVEKKADGSYFFLFLVKFYPEVIEDELVQDITRHLFFLQIKQSILSMDLYCQPEAAVLLASFAVQAMYGDYEEDIELELDKLLPQTVIDQYDMTSEMWKDRIRNWWLNNSGLTIEEAEMEYLRVAQDLSMYGIQYYPIYNQKDTDLLLGISAQGLGIYETSSRMSPRPFFPWSEIKNIHFNNKLFTIKVTDKSKIKFRAQETSVNHSILDLCIGTHNLYLRRRQADTLEIQQMKAQAQDQRTKRSQEMSRWQKEHEQRIQAELERDRLRQEVEMVNERLNVLEEMLRSTEETNKSIAEKARISEEEAFELSKRANQAEAEVQRIKMSQIEAEEMKIALERKVRDAESLAHRLIQETGRTYSSQMGLNNDEQYLPYLTYAIQNLSPSRNNSVQSRVPEDLVAENAAEGEAPSNRNSKNNFNGYSANPVQFPATYSSQYFNEELEGLRNQMEKQNEDYKKRNHDFRERLSEFRREIDALKIEDRQSDYDKMHETAINNGWDKYSTLRKSGSGSSKSRVRVFDGL